MVHFEKQPLSDSHKRLPALFACLLIAQPGCHPPPLPSTAPTNSTVWITSGVGHLEGTQVVYHFTHLSYTDGSSFAIVVPWDGRSDSATDSVTDHGYLVFSLVTDTASVVYDDRLLAQVPERNNRCYILGRDMTLHDTGRSADWLLWLVSPSSGDPEYDRGIYTKTESLREHEATFTRDVLNRAFPGFVQFQVMPLSRVESDGLRMALMK